MKKKNGFTLVEVLVAIAVASILLFMALPNSAKVKSTAEDNSMKMRAMAMTTAKLEFVRDAGVTTAATAWSNASTNQAKYDLLRPYIKYAPAALADYSTLGYSINPGATVDDPVGLFRGATPIDYLSANQ